MYSNTDNINRLRKLPRTVTKQYPWPLRNISQCVHNTLCYCHRETMESICAMYSISLLMKTLTNDPQVVFVADSWLYVRIVLCSGHTLQVALMIRFD